LRGSSQGLVALRDFNPAFVGSDHAKSVDGLLWFCEQTSKRGEIGSEVIGSNTRGAATRAGAVFGRLIEHLSSPGGGPDQYEEEQSGKHIARVYIFEA
jgi:hypothetical protein